MGVRARLQVLPHAGRIRLQRHHDRRMIELGEPMAKEDVMKEMEMLLKTVSEGLRMLAQGVKVVADKLDSFAEESQKDSERSAGRRVPVREAPVKPPAEKPSRKTEERARPKGKKVPSAADKVVEAMSRVDGPASIDQLAQLTGYDRKQINNALFKLKKQGKVENVGKGVYRRVA